MDERGVRNMLYGLFLGAVVVLFMFAISFAIIHVTSS
jgi:hypothetical protein